ncbi:unnamed protein product [Cuscuta campestris]|uniref:Ubiquitin-like protease family profile domain-containing protein n=1 Tax=Cuscuta campestris TaxID=132261 RepID=A0A484M3X8_9ASTE|nr:unnamed protein product [Cuscuta campestris]
MSSKANDKILSYNDVVLRRSDLDILSGPYFLNDRIIEFYFSFLASRFPSEDVLLLSPSITFWIKECRDTTMLKDFIEPLRLSQRKLIIFPINDNSDVDLAEGGSHWSLLAFERGSNVFVHHDSISGCINKNDARHVYEAVLPFTASGMATYVDYSGTPKQENWYDCGVYVLSFARVICDWYGSRGPEEGVDMWFPSLKEQINAGAVSEMRDEIRRLIVDLMARK